MALNNITDYGDNFQFVKHVLEMDTTFRGNPLGWRAFHWAPVHHAVYVLIIGAEVAAGLLAGLAAARMIAGRDDPVRFRRGKALGVIALALGCLLWLVGFEIIGGEYFMMWQSPSWNGQEAAFRFLVVYLLGMIFLAQDE
jgi:predicted small integral membrane protein